MLEALRSTSIRLALGFAGLFILASLLLVGALWWQTAAYLDREIDAVILSDTEAIADRLKDGGLAGALQAVRDRAGEDGDRNAIYLMTNPAFEPLAGNLASWPRDVSPKPGWYHLRMFRGSEARATRLLNVGLPGGFELLVGRDVEERERVRRLIVNGLASGTVVLLALAVFGGLIARRALLGRIAMINQTAAAIVGGDLTHRLPVRGSVDEFDQLSLTINRMLEQIQALIEGVRNVSNAVAHDLRTPLAEMRVRLEQVLQNAPASEAANVEIEGAISEIDRLIAMSNALLRLAEIDSGVRRSGFRPVNLMEIVQEAVELYEPISREKGVALIATAPDVPPVMGDPMLLAQAIANLIDNAVKYAPTGGHIGVSLAQQAAEVCVTVADDGPGIDAAERARVVERFYRGESSRDRPGVGLGLTLVASVAKLHHGRLALDDNGPGLRASIVIPAAESANGNS